MAAEARNRRRGLSERLGLRVRSTDLRRSLESKEDLEAKLKAEKEQLEKLREQFGAAQASLRNSCGSFRGVFRTVTFWGKAVHDTIREIIDELRRARAIRAKLKQGQGLVDDVQELLTVALVEGGALADSLRRQTVPLGSRSLARDTLIVDLHEAAGVATAREQLLSAIVAAEELVGTVCNAFKYKWLGSKLMPSSCTELTINPDRALASLSQFDLGSMLYSTIGQMQSNADQIALQYGSATAKDEVLVVSELVNLEELRAFGSATFDLLAPIAAATAERGDHFSGALYRRGPYFCSESLKFDAVEMSKVGILLFNSRGELLGPPRDSGLSNGADLTVAIKLESPFSKTWQGNVTSFKLPAFSSLSYSYNKPVSGMCSQGFPSLGGILCEGSAQGQPGKTQALPSPYARWTITVNKESRKFLADVADVAIIADLTGVINPSLECRPKVVPYKSLGGEEAKSGGLGTTTIALIASGVAIAVLASAAAVLRHRRRSRASGAPIDDNNVVSVNPVFRAPPAAAVDQQGA